MNDRSGTRGGNVRDLDTARDLHEQHKARWTTTVREAIRQTFLEKSELHADDLAELGIPSEHQSIIGSQIARLVNGKLIVAVDRRKCEHPAANGRKANVYNLTDLGRKKLAEVSAGVLPQQAGSRTRSSVHLGGSARLFDPPAPKPRSALTDAEAA